VSFGDSIVNSMMQGGKTIKTVLIPALGSLEKSLLDLMVHIGVNSLYGLFGNNQPLNIGGTGGNLGGFYASGGVFDLGNVIPFASGGIVTSPTLFPMARGAGLMGENGPEAVMPLKRGADGKLGVSGGGGAVTNNFIVENHTGGNVTEHKTKNSSGGIDHRVIIRDAVADDLANGRFDGPMRARYGQQLRARPR
jgi:lambda family phage tail tape measure protein